MSICGPGGAGCGLAGLPPRPEVRPERMADGQTYGHTGRGSGKTASPSQESSIDYLSPFSTTPRPLAEKEPPHADRWDPAEIIQGWLVSSFLEMLVFHKI